MVEMRTVHVPSFLHTQVNKREDGSLMTPQEVLADNLVAALKACDPDDRELIVLAFREKADDNFRYGICCVTLKDDENIMLHLSGAKRIPNILIGKTYDFIKVVKKVLSNIVFS